MKSKRITIVIAAVIIVASIIVLMAERKVIMDFFGFYQPSSAVCGQEGDALGGDIDHCCAGLKPTAAKPQMENGAPSGRFECSKI